MPGNQFSLVENQERLKHAFVVLTAHIAGSCFEPTHYETNPGKSSNGTEPMLISRIASGRKKSCEGASSIFQKGSVLPTWEAGSWTLRVVSLTGRMNFSTFMVLIRRKKGPALRNTWQTSIRRIASSCARYSTG